MTAPINLHGSLGYDLDPVDDFDAGFGWEDREVLNQTLNYQTAAAAGPLALDYAAPGLFHGAYASTSESLGYVRTLPGDGQTRAPFSLALPRILSFASGELRSTSLLIEEIA